MSDSDSEPQRKRIKEDKERDERESPSSVSNEEAEEAMRQFAFITNTDEILAQSILQDVNWKLESALEVYYERKKQDEEEKTKEESENDDNDVMILDREESDESPAVDLDGLELSLITWNIDGLDNHYVTTRVKAVYQVLKEVNADFVFLQEVVEAQIVQLDRSRRLYDIYYSNRGSLYFTAILVSKRFLVEKHEVIPYSNSGMGRTLQIVEGRIGTQKVFLMNTHLESTAEHTQERQDQFLFCMRKIDLLVKEHPNCLLFFGGDLNLRKHEESGVSSELRDTWIAAGQQKNCQFTFDMVKNNNKSLPGVRCRFDRIYWRGPLPTVQFSLRGTQRIRSTLCFPSDHFAVYCEFS